MGRFSLWVREKNPEAPGRVQSKAKNRLYMARAIVRERGVVESSGDGEGVGR